MARKRPARNRRPGPKPSTALERTTPQLPVPPQPKPSQPAGASSLIPPPQTAAESFWNEQGVDQNLPFSAPFIPREASYDDKNKNLFEVVRGWEDEEGPNIGQLVAMRRMDGQARALYRLITLPIRAALSGADWIAADGGQAEADYIKQVFTLPAAQGGMEVPFNRFMSQLLMSIFDGFSAFEQVYWVPTKGPLKGKITLQKLAYRPSETVTFITDESGNFAGIRQRAFVNSKYVDAFIPKDRCFYYAAQEEERKFYGVSYFQSAYYHYDKKMKLYFIAHLAAQRAAVGTRVGTVPQNATVIDRQKFAESLSNLAVAQYMMYPEGFSVEVLREGGSFDFLNFVNHHNSQMSKSILATFFDEDKGGGSADSKMINFGGSDNDMFILMLQAIMADIEQAINHFVIPKLVDYNFSGGKYPQFTFGKVTEEQKGAILGMFETLATAGQGINVTPEMLRELEENVSEQLGLQVDYAKVEKREKAAQEQSQAMQDASQQVSAGLATPAGSAADAQAQTAAQGDQAVSQFEQQAMQLTAGEEIDEEILSLTNEDDYAAGMKRWE